MDYKPVSLSDSRQYFDRLIVNETLIGFSVLLNASVKQMKSLMEADEGIRLWDDLFEIAFEYHDLNHLSFTEVDNGIKVSHEVNDDVEGQAKDCAVAIIHSHASVVSEFIQRGTDEAQANHPAPDECSGM